MFVATAVLCSLLALVLIGSSLGVARREPAVRSMLERLDVVSLAPLIVVVDLLAAFGLLVGLLSPPVGVVAAAGTVVYMVAALVLHARAHDDNVAPALAVLLLAGAALALRLVTA